MGILHESLFQLARHGYLVLFAWVAAEQLGLPIPAAPILIAAGVLSAMGQLTWFSAFALAILACLIGDTAWYLLGKWKGTTVLKTLCRISLEPESCVRQGSDVIGRYGGRFFLVSKFVPGIGAVAIPMAARSGIPLLSFVVYDFLGCAIYVGAYMAIGSLLGGRLDKLEMLAGSLRALTVAFVVAGTIAILAWRFRQRRKFLGDLRMARIKPEEVRALIDGGEQPYIVDLRHALDFLPDPRVIPGAIRMTPDDVTARQQEIPRDREIILYCT